MAFRTIISLGEDCEVAHQLRRRFGVERAGLFDWWISSLHGLIRVLREGPGELLAFHDLEPIDERQAMASRSHGIVFHHDFRRGPDGLVDVEAAPSQIAEVQAKSWALWKRLNRDCEAGGPVLFVRARRRDQFDLGPDPEDRNEGQALADLRRAAMERWPASDLHFLFLGYCPSFAAQNVTFDEVADAGDISGWSGSDRGWDQMLERRHVELQPPSR